MWIQQGANRVCLDPVLDAQLTILCSTGQGTGTEQGRWSDKQETGSGTGAQYKADLEWEKEQLSDRT
jgi:hypothetical protein